MEHRAPYLIKSLCSRLALTLCALLIGCTPAETTNTSGKVSGALKFEKTSPDISKFLISNSISSGHIHLFSPGNITLSQTSDLIPRNTLDTGNNYFTAATYTIKPAVDPDGSTFFPKANVEFNSGDSYRFGSRTGPLTCGLVLPADNIIDGKVCNITECAALARLSLNLGKVTDARDALAGIDPDAPLSCTVSAMTETGEQARSRGHDFLLHELQGEGGVVEFLIRADGSNYDFRATCKAKPLAGARDYILNGKGQVEASASLTASTAATCGSIVNASIHIPVDRGNTGSLSGYFDITGHDESAAAVVLNGAYVHAISPESADAQESPLRNIRNLPSGLQKVSAAANIQGNTITFFPYKTVNIIPGQTTDIGTTFMAHPSKAVGTVKLLDPGQTTELGQFISTPFIGLSQGKHNSYVTSRRIGPAATIQSSYGRLNGNFESRSGAVDASYQLLMTGLSPVTGPSDGKSVFATANQVTNVRVSTGQPASNQSSVGIFLDYNNPDYFIHTAKVDSSKTIQLPEERICFGQVEVQFSADTAFSSVYGPELTNISGLGQSPANTSIPGSIYTVPGPGNRAYGVPRSASPQTSTALVSAVLPAGYQYRVTPRLHLVTTEPNSVDTVATLPVWTMPQTPLGCSQAARSCLQLNTAGDNYSPLDVGILPAQPYCQVDEKIEFTVHVNSDGANVDWLQYTVDGGNPATLCTNCGPDPAPQFALLKPLPAGKHVIEITAGNTSGCSASFTYAFHIAAEAVSLHAPDHFSVFLNPNENVISATDPRIRDVLNKVFVTGGCDLQTAPEDDRNTITFDKGSHMVTFSLPGTDITVSTTVSIENSQQQLAYLDGNYLMICRAEDGGLFAPPVPFLNPKKVVYDPSGRKVAVLQPGGIFVRDADDPTVSLGSFSGNFVDVAFRPGSNAGLALIEETESQYRLKITSPLQADYQSDTISLSGPQGQIVFSPPRLAWSKDGSRVAVVYNTIDASASTATDIYLKEWELGKSSVSEEEPWSWHYKNKVDVISLSYIAGTPENRIALATTQGLFVFDRNSPNLLHEFAKELTHAAYSDDILAATMLKNDNARLIAWARAAEVEGPVTDINGGPVATSSGRIAHFPPGHPSVNIYRIETTESSTAKSFISDQTCSVATSIHQSDGLAFRPEGQELVK